MRNIHNTIASLAVLLTIGAGTQTASAELAPKVIQKTPEELKLELRQLKTELALRPQDAQLHFKLGECLRNLGQLPQASDEYAKAGTLDPSMYVAYHQLSLTSQNAVQLDEAIEKLNKLANEKPKELLLRVALSELYEKRGNYYQAARTLIDLSYANAVPEKFKTKVATRIHNMLALSKTQKNQTVEAATASTPNSDEELDVVPAPLPTPTTKRSLAHARLKDKKEVRGMGHTPLVP
ncbi:MAG: hypothetical protein K2X77_13605 [Candidatus Obscuribacterales bacterium]|nr:hypothetical protein [Candidatus Obscuribacterales bacterium]